MLGRQVAYGVLMVLFTLCASCDVDTEPTGQVNTEPRGKTRVDSEDGPQAGEPEPVSQRSASVAVTVAPDLPPGATLLDPDMIWDMWKPNNIAISPDGQWIAYISKGAIWLCSVTTGPPIKLTDLPNTVTEYRSTPNYRQKRGDFNKLDSTVTAITFYNRPKKSLSWIVGLKWTPSQDGVFYTLGNSLQIMPYTTTYRVMHASTKGVATTVATIIRDTYDEPHRLFSFDVTHDRSMVVVSNGYTPLIWDASTDKPRATCFDYLLPSSSSGRFLGIEIDTRQLVVTDENLMITKRLDVTFDPRRFSNMFWSPDERFAICVSRLEYAFQNKNRWVGFRINLETGEQRPLKDGRFASRNAVEEYVTDQFVFTGHGGDVIRVSSTSMVGLGFVNGGNTYIAIVPDRNGPPKDIYRFKQPPWPSEKYRTRKPYPPVRLSRDGTLFAIALPREGEKLGYRYWLIDRGGNKWPFGPDDPSLYVSPYRVVALADNGRQVVACDDVQLFSIPVATIQGSGGAKDE